MNTTISVTPYIGMGDTGSNPVLTTFGGIGVPLEAKYKPWSLNVNQPLN
jgi:hypothetical protein